MIDLGGLCKGAGDNPLPGKPASFCVQQAVSLALGEDDPQSYPVVCVGETVKGFGVSMNDREWPSVMARGKGMRRFAVAELGSNRISQTKFNYMVGEKWAETHPHALGCTANDLAEEVHIKDLPELAEVAVQVLIELGTEGSKWLDYDEKQLKAKKKELEKNLMYVPQLEWKQYGRKNQATCAPRYCS